MDISKIRALSNNYNDVRLVSLREWKAASTIVPRDHGGPYVVMQDGYDPSDPKMAFDEFILGKAGAWVTMGIFMKLPQDVRRQEFVYGTAAEVIMQLEALAGKPKIVRTSEGAAALAPVAESDKPTEDDLTTAFKAAKEAKA